MRIGSDVEVEAKHITYKYNLEREYNAEGYAGWVDTTNLLHFPSYATPRCAQQGEKAPGTLLNRECPGNSSFTFYSVEYYSGYTLRFTQLYEVINYIIYIYIY